MIKETEKWSNSIWIGVKDNDFDEYINQDKYGKSCGFCQDIGQGYDVDNIYIYVSKNIIPIEKLVEEVPFSECFENEIIKRCHAMGLIEGNALISLLDEEFDFSTDKIFSGLRFVGVFECWFSDEYLKRCGLA
ncbi:immunity 22 family protein [Salmonella enterica]|uniref:immunity 22 family protein n=1 Tax=Salmonella enterica TaxID=28901 RepID=UPI0007C8889C|nr:immunity 22 family protein [Salmonella enterica]ELG9727329.1 immunity 22 family protein [Salmonella enterica subsp. enterica serovar Rough O:z29]EAB3338194.1 hypothetical protein [Salmonella enterica]EAN5262997.1 hypothetical protein [Salmonella enterica]EAO7931708.1 hypothetical protein [Salmonella enterica]EAP3619179.1 hypothetical protein [Salmonella enterica]